MYPYQEVEALRKKGRLDEAYRKAKELFRDHKDDRYLKNSFGWVLYDKIKATAEKAGRDRGAQGQSNSGEIRQLLREYSRLGLPRPHLLFSCLLSQILRLPGKLEFLPAFMAWAGLGCFRPEDLRAQQGKGDVVYAPLVEKAARVTAKAARRLDDPQRKEFAIVLLDKAIGEGEVQGLPWLHYNKALLLRELERPKEAQALLLPFVRKKRGDFWAWHALGKMEEGTDPELALALYAKACVTCGDLKFGVNVFEDLSRVASEHGQVGLAKWAANKAYSVRRNVGWRLPQSLRHLLDSDWYASAEDLADLDKVLADCAAAADRIVYADCPHHEATYLGTFKAKSEKLMLKVALRRGDGREELVSPARGLIGESQFSVGDAIMVGIFEEAERVTIVDIKGRESGEPFDCLKEVFGVIDHQNSTQGLASVYVTATKFCLLAYREFPSVQRWAPGSSVMIRCTESKERLTAFYATGTDFQETEWIMQVAGKISLHPKGFGFVNAVFVPPHLARTYEGEQEVTLVAARKLNKKTNKLGWTAIGPLGS